MAVNIQTDSDTVKSWIDGSKYSNAIHYSICINKI